MCRGTCWSQSEACQRCVPPSRRPPCSSWDNFEVAMTVKLSSTSLPVMAKELRKNSIVERPFPTGFGWTSALVALYPNFESLLEKGSSKIDLAWCWEMHLASNHFPAETFVASVRLILQPLSLSLSTKLYFQCHCKHNYHLHLSFRGYCILFQPNLLRPSTSRSMFLQRP